MPVFGKVNPVVRVSPSFTPPPPETDANSKSKSLSDAFRMYCPVVPPDGIPIPGNDSGKLIVISSSRKLTVVFAMFMVVLRRHLGK